MRYFPMTVAGILILVGAFSIAYGFRGLRVASDDAGHLFAFSQLAWGFGSIASSAVIATLAAILAILEDKLGKN